MQESETNDGGAEKSLVSLAPDLPEDPDPERWRQRGANLRAWLLRWWRKAGVIALGFALLVTTAVLGAQASLAQTDPVPVVEEYLGAIARGDAATASRMIAPAVAYDSAPWLQPEVLSSASERITVDSVTLLDSAKAERLTEDAYGDISEDDKVDRVWVRAKLSLAGESFESDFELVSKDNGLRGPDEWELRTPLVGVAEVQGIPEFGPSGAESTAEIAGEKVVLDQRQGYYFGAALAYPAVYDASLDVGKYLDAGAAKKLIVAPWSTREQNRASARSLASMEVNTTAHPAVFELPLSTRFKESMFRQGLQLAEGCAAQGYALAEPGDHALRCPSIFQSVVVDACLADPAAETVAVASRTISCKYYRELIPYRGPISVELMSKSFSLESYAPSYSFFSLGTYRATEAETGAFTDMKLYEVGVRWVDGHPVIYEGGFSEKG
jgi:hypothetical protein